MAKIVIGSGTKIAGFNIDPSLLQTPFAPLVTSKPLTIGRKDKGIKGQMGHKAIKVHKEVLKKRVDDIKQELKVEKEVKKEVKQEVEEEEVGRGNPKGKGRTAAGRASKAASCSAWKHAKRAVKREGVLAMEIEKKSLLLQEEYSPFPPPFQAVALLLCSASLKATLYKDFITTKTKGNGWKHQWGDAHVLFLTSFKQELAKHETEVSRCEVKIGALWKAWKVVKGPHLNPQGAEEGGGSALRAEWERVAPKAAEEAMKAMEMLEAEVVKELQEMAIASSDSLSQG